MKLLLTLAFLAMTSIFPTAPADSSVAGTWKVTGDVMGNPVNPVCVIKQDDKKLSGSCKASGTDTPLTGTIDDKKVTWQFNVEFNGDNLTIIMDGTLDTDSKMKGKIHVQPYGVDGDFTADKDGDAPKSSSAK